MAEATTSKFADVEVGEDGMPDEAILMQGLKAVIDPEIGYNIVDLGLVYEVTVDEERIAVLMTMTTPACPLGPYIEQSVDLALADVADGRAVEVEITFDPPWTPDMISTEGRRELGWPA